VSSPVRTYRFHPLERRGLAVGLTVPQVATLAVGLLGALGAFRALGGPGGVGLALLLVALAGGAACWPLAGATPVQWAPVAWRWLAGRRRPLLALPGGSAAPPGVRLLAAPCAPGDEPLGVVEDRRSGSWAAVLPVAGRSFTLLDPTDKHRRLAAWGAVLASTARAGNPLYRLQWVERTVPSDRGALLRALDEAADPGRLPAAVDSYRELVRQVGATTTGHEVLLVVAVHPRRAARQRRSFGRGEAATCALLRRELRLLRGQLRTAELDPGAPLDLPRLVTTLRSAFDPPSRRHPPNAAGAAWPLAWYDGWTAARVDGRLHATYWVAEWPRCEVGPDFLAPLLASGGARAVAVTMAPVPPERAVREVESAKTAELADAELRRRAGFVPTARHRRQAEGVREREAELADGHAELRFSGYVTVSGGDDAELETACAAVETAGHQAGLQLRRLYGQQAAALTWTLPLARGLS
jgi:hypothetical protein